MPQFYVGEKPKEQECKLGVVLESDSAGVFVKIVTEKGVKWGLCYIDNDGMLRLCNSLPSSLGLQLDHNGRIKVK